MYDRVATPIIDIYDGKTNEYYGSSIFPVTTEIENSLLQIVNYEGTPRAMLFQDDTFLPASSSYVPPGLFEKVRRNGIVRASFRDANSYLWVPIEIYMNFDSQVRGNLLDDKYHFDSVVYTDIDVQDVKVLPRGEGNTV
nr:hypothetical protein [Oscillibacter sp.]